MHDMIYQALVNMGNNPRKGFCNCGFAITHLMYVLSDSQAWGRGGVRGGVSIRPSSETQGICV